MSHQLWIAFILLALALMGCGGDPIEEAHFIRSIPASGGEIAVDESLVLMFDHPPGTVTVNNTPATTEGKQATWQAQGLTPGQEAKLEVKWDTGSATLTFFVKPKENPAPDNEPPSVVRITIPQGCHFLYTKQVTHEIGRTICDQEGLFFCGDWPADLPGLEDPQDPRPALEVTFDPVLKYQDTLVVVTGTLNAQKEIRVQFSEPIQGGQAKLLDEGFDIIGHLAYGFKDDFFFIDLTKVYEYQYDTTYVMELTTHDEAGNELRAKIQFHTTPLRKIF